MKQRNKNALLTALGLALCILPATWVTLQYFPIWLSEGRGATMSALSCMLLFLAFLPLRRFLKPYFRTPSAWMLWLLLYLFLSLIDHIFEGIRAIALVAFPTSFLGDLCFRMRRPCGGETKQ